jgi:CheY-like chemotaxis protein
MKKILVADPLKSLIEEENSFCAGRCEIVHRGDERGLLALHQAEKVNLIISPLDLPGMSTDRLFSAIRSDRHLRSVSLIIVCSHTTADKKRADQCCPNAILTLPVNSELLLEKVRSFLNISGRESYRVLLSVNIEGSSRETSFFCRSENISTTGLLIETDRDLEDGDRLKCSFFLPDSRHIIATGEIVRKIEQPEKSVMKRYGVKFDTLHPDARAAIDVFIEKKAQMSRAKRS